MIYFRPKKKWLSNWNGFQNKKNHFIYVNFFKSDLNFFNYDHKMYTNLAGIGWYEFQSKDLVTKHDLMMFLKILKI